MARKKYRRRRTSPLALVIALALLGGAFGLGWHFGVESKIGRAHV